MNYEEKYKEALERAKKLHDSYNLMHISVDEIEQIFPELAESEDERIRMAIIEHFKQSEQIYPGLTFGGYYYADVRAWLEKQKEQKPNIEICPHSIKSKSYKENGYYPIENCDYGLEIAENILEKTLGKVEGYQSDDGIREHQTAIQAVKDAMKEQKPVDLSDMMVHKEPYIAPIPTPMVADEQGPAEKQDYTTLTDIERAINRGFLSAGVTNIPVEIIEETAKECIALMKPAEWSDEDKDKLYQVMEILLADKAVALRDTPHCKILHEAYDKMLAWLKSLPERFNLQPKQEWSEEDEKMLKRIEAILLTADDDLSDKLNGKVSPITDSEYSSMKLCIAKCRSWLKARRPSWKPNDEDEVRLINTSISFLKDFADKGYENAVECIDWLKSKLNGDSGK